MLSVYCDGSSSGRGGRPGGWGFVVVRQGRPVAAGAGSHRSTTNNVMELMAAIQGLRAVIAGGLRLPQEPLELVSDSQYTLGMASGAYAPAANKELALELRELARGLGARCRWVPGHTGDQWNERCDRLAKHAKEREKRHGLDGQGEKEPGGPGSGA